MVLPAPVVAGCRSDRIDGFPPGSGFPGCCGCDGGQGSFAGAGSYYVAGSYSGAGKFGVVVLAVVGGSLPGPYSR